MKNALVRLLTLVTLASSLTGFASAGESKHNDTNASATQQSGCADTTQGKKAKKDKGAQQDKTDQEKEFEHMLMGIYG